MEQKTGFKEVFLRLVAIVGLIAVLVLGAWGIILLAFNVIGFFNGTNTSISSLFTHDTTVATDDTITQNSGSQTAVKVTPVTTPTQATKPTAVYTPAVQSAPLYGLPDLAVTITSVTPLNSYAGRTSVQFVVENIGTNIAARGWSFNALLPLTPTYTYQSGAQQALYPGDKIAYTLTYDNQNQQYNYNNNQYSNNYQYPYQQPTTCYTYNGYQNIPGPCAYGYDSNGNPIYGSNVNQYNYNNQYTVNPNYNYYNNTNTQNYYGNGYYPYGGTVTITVDPQNWVPEAIEYNNTASKNF